MVPLIIIISTFVIVGPTQCRAENVATHSYACSPYYLYMATVCAFAGFVLAYSRYAFPHVVSVKEHGASKGSPPPFREMGNLGAESKPITKKHRCLLFISVFIEYSLLTINIQEHVTMSIDPQGVN